LALAHTGMACPAMSVLISSAKLDQRCLDRSVKALALYTIGHSSHPLKSEFANTVCGHLVRVVKKISSSIPRQSTGLRLASSHECCDSAVYGWGRGSEIFSICVIRSSST
jgi:hypothetical protein